MPPYRSFFIGAVSFLSGVALQSAEIPFYFFAIAVVFAIAVFYYSGISAKITAVFIFLILAGGFYYAVHDYKYHLAIKALPESPVHFTGTVINVPEVGLNHATFYLKTDYGKLLARTAPYPEYSYGDKLSFFGEIEQPPRNYYGNYLAKEGVVGTIFFPKIDYISSANGNSFILVVTSARENIRDSFRKFFNRDQAALLSGITLGIKDDFSEEFLENLSLSGTRHLTAISGLHMTIVVMLLSSAFLFFLPRKYAFFLTFIFIFLFVAMTGFKVSAIRASVMGFIGGAAREMGRFYAQHNVIITAAVLLVLFNPKILFFDTGFHLSFLAVVSIIYFMPAMKKLLRIGNNPGFLGWREALSVTVSAQLAVAPILINSFGGFSPVSFAANVLVLVFIPFVLGAGFVMAIFSFFSYYLTFLSSLIIVPVLEYIIFIVNLFAGFSFMFSPALSVPIVLAYYCTLCFLSYKSRAKPEGIK